jgi:signal transduction histidine kinase
VSKAPRGDAAGPQGYPLRCQGLPFGPDCAAAIIARHPDNGVMRVAVPEAPSSSGGALRARSVLTRRSVFVEQGLWLLAILVAQGFAYPKVASQVFAASPYIALVGAATVAAYALLGAWLLGDVSQRGNARILLFATTINAVVYLPGEPADNSWWPLIEAAHTSSGVLLAWFLLRFPDSRLADRTSRTVVGVAAVWWPIITFAAALVPRPWQPTPLGDAASFERWFGSSAVEAHFWLRNIARGPVTQLLALALVVLLIRRVVQAPRHRRRILLPVLVPAAVLELFVIVEPFVAPPGSLSEGSTNVRFLLICVLLLVLAAGIVVAAVSRRLAAASLADLVTILGRREVDVRDALRRTLDDAELDVYFWIGPREGRSESTDASRSYKGAAPLEVSSGYVDRLGRTLSPVARPGRRLEAVTDRAGNPLALVDVDASTGSDPGLLGGALQVSALAIENERLQAQVLAQLEEVRASRARIVAAGVEERRAVERDLHDGAQQRLLALSTTLALLGATVHDESAQALVEQARGELRSSLAELRNLARGIHPAVLTQIGLRAALEDVIERLPLSVRLDVPDVRLPSNVETTVYYAVAEALTNVVKHSGATTAEVSVMQGDPLLVRICDNGFGITESAGILRGSMADRVHALGGDLRVISRPATGDRWLHGDMTTVVEAFLPLR